MTGRRKESVEELIRFVDNAIKANPIKPPHENVTTILIPNLDLVTSQMLKDSLEEKYDHATDGYSVQCELVFEKTSKGRIAHYDVRVVREAI